MKLKVFVPVAARLDEQISKMESYVKPYLRPDTKVIYKTFKYGFSSIETELQGMFNGTEVIRYILNDEDDCDGYFVDCFDDPGVYAARELGKKFVIGPYQAAIASALSIGERIGVITTDEAGILSEERKRRIYGVEDRIVSIKDIDLGVLDIEADSQLVLARLQKASSEMIEKDRVTAICLGCTAMFSMGDELSKILRECGYNVSVIEPFRNGLCYLEYLLSQGYTNYISGGVNLDSLNWSNR